MIWKSDLEGGSEIIVKWFFQERQRREREREEEGKEIMRKKESLSMMNMNNTSLKMLYSIQLPIITPTIP